MKHINQFESFDKISEEKGEKWIQDAIKRPGALRKKLGKKGEEKISKGEITDEISKLKKKDKDPKKSGIQGLSKKDLTKLRQLNLAKTLKGMKESHDHENYMFFTNLENIKRMAEEILAMNHEEMDQKLTHGHDWATDHISVANENLEHVYNFFLNDESDEHEHSEEECGDFEGEEEFEAPEVEPTDMVEEEEEEDESCPCPECNCYPCKCDEMKMEGRRFVKKF
jgi:hypothetical protein